MESTRSQNITVSWRRSASGGREVTSGDAGLDRWLSPGQKALWSCLVEAETVFRGPCDIAGPYQDTVFLVYRQLFGVDEFVFHRFKEVVIKLEAHLQSAIRDTVVSLQ